MLHIPSVASIAPSHSDRACAPRMPGRPRAAWRSVALLAGTLGSTLAHAAGGHHAVDDATILEPGRCHVESWHARDRGAGTRLWQLGPACHIGGIEWALGMASERAADDQARVLSPQAKWATDTPLPGLALGVAIGIDVDARNARRNGRFVHLPATYALETTHTLLHGNLGRRLERGGGSHALWGLAVEQTIAGPLSAVVERFRDAPLGRATQLGLRWEVRTDALSIDLGHARGSGGDARRSWTLGVTVEFDGPGERK